MPASKFIFFLVLVLSSQLGFSQANQLELNQEKVTKYSIYLAARHGGPQGLEQFKNSDKYGYHKEMWYFTESFYVKRNHQNEGVSMDDSMIDITRFEHYRKVDEDAVVVLPGFKDAIILLASKKLVYKPNYN